MDSLPPCRRLQQTTVVTSAVGVAAVALWAAASLLLAASAAAQGRAHALRPWPDPRLLRLPWRRAALRLLAVIPVVLTAFM